MAKGSASTARTCTAISSTRRRCGCRSSSGVPAWRPGRGSTRVTRSVDLFPTLLELAGIRASVPAGSGRSLTAALPRRTRSATSHRSRSRCVPLVHFGWSDLRTVRDGRWKYILAPRPGAVRPRARCRRDEQPRGSGAGARPRDARGTRRTAAARAARGAGRRRPRARCRRTCSRSSAPSATSAPADLRRRRQRARTRRTSSTSTRR